MFEIINNTSNKLVDIDILKVEEYIKFICKKQNLENAIFNIIFVSSEEIHKINKEYRNGIAYPNMTFSKDQCK